MVCCLARCVELLSTVHQYNVDYISYRSFSANSLCAWTDPCWRKLVFSPRELLASPLPFTTTSLYRQLQYSQTRWYSFLSVHGQSVLCGSIRTLQEISRWAWRYAQTCPYWTGGHREIEPTSCIRLLTISIGQTRSLYPKLLSSATRFHLYYEARIVFRHSAGSSHCDWCCG